MYLFFKSKFNSSLFIKYQQNRTKGIVDFIFKQEQHMKENAKKLQSSLHTEING